MWGRILIKAYTVKKIYSQKGKKGGTHFHIGIYRIKSFKTFFVNNMRSEKLQDVQNHPNVESAEVFQIIIPWGMMGPHKKTKFVHLTKTSY